MEVSENWKKMYKRIYTQQPALRELLAQIPNDAIRELSTSGSLLAISGETVARRAAGKERGEQFRLAGEVGRYLVEFERSEELHLRYTPNCWTALSRRRRGKK